MSGTAAQIEWYIARDGARHGPISDVEMQKFVELGHLKPTDLVWCQRFSEWQLASVVFAGEDAKPAVAVAPAAVMGPAGHQIGASSNLAPSDSKGGSPDDPVRHVPAAGISQAQPHVAQRSASQGAIQTGGESAAGVQAAPSIRDDEAWAQAMRSVLVQPAPQSPRRSTMPAGVQASGQPGGQIGVAQAPAGGTRPIQPAVADNRGGGSFAAGGSTAAGRAARSVADLNPSHDAYIQASTQAYAHQAHAQPTAAGSGYAQGSAPSHASDAFDHHGDVEFAQGAGAAASPRSRDWVSVAAMVSAVLLIVGGLGWVGWQNRSIVAGASAIGGAIKSKVSSGIPVEAFKLSPYEAPGETADVVDAGLQRTAIWRLLKRDHPEWYDERVADVARMRTEKREEKAISRFLADVIITLRRRNALTALQSSPEHLRGMARRFSENLRQLGSRDGSTCFAFITYGEANPMALDISRTPAFAETLQRQLIAIFEAINDGKANRVVHPVTRRTDYDLLTKDLMARGWTAADLATFSDPQKLSSSPPEKVCTLVQEWFATHLAMTDAELQTRLLAESLKPLVGG